MSKLNGTGPEGDGSLSGRKLGLCEDLASIQEKLEKLGKGLGKRKYVGGGVGHGKRLKAGLKEIDQLKTKSQ